MTVQVTQIPTPALAVVPDFGWWYNPGSPTALYYRPDILDLQVPLNTTITFDTVNSQSFGLISSVPFPTTMVPSGITIISYRWNFTNGDIGYGPVASTRFDYPVSPPDIIVSLSVLDNLGRYWSVAHPLSLKYVPPSGGGYRESGGSARA